LLAAINAAAWLALLDAARIFPLLLPLGVTAYLLGLRHAVDPDHIAAIDGTTRKLLRDGQKPVAVGFYFSLGHSTIVFALSILVAVFGVVLKTRFPVLQSAGAVVGTWISALFLIAIAAANAVVLVEILRGSASPDDAELPGGVLTRILRPALGLVKRSWQMYPVGVLFGLGFDTATEIALLGISAASGAGGMPVAYILILPALFVSGMSLVDTTEGIAVLGAYGWAYLQPARRVLYNMNMTLLTITIALFVGGAEAFAAIGAHPVLSFPTLGYGIMAILGGNVALSAFFYRFKS
jgi:high-affinity nickel-transport protein